MSAYPLSLLKNNRLAKAESTGNQLAIGRNSKVVSGIGGEVDVMKRIILLLSFQRETQKIMKTENYDIYFPVQLWVSIHGRYRLQPPLLGIANSYKFPSFFWHDPSSFSQEPDPSRLFISPELNLQLQKEWFLQSTFWAWNPNSGPYLNRGFFSIMISQRREAPFDSQFVFTTDGPLPVFSDTALSFPYQVFSFFVYSFMIRDCSLLFIQHREDSLNIRLCHGECPVEKDLPFLPSHEGKHISCYHLYKNDRGLFAYVFPKRPIGKFFRLTTENICIPSSDPSDYPCFFDCMTASLSPRVLSDNVYTESSNQALQTVMYTFPKTVQPWWKQYPPSSFLSSMMLSLLACVLLGVTLFIKNGKR